MSKQYFDPGPILSEYCSNHYPDCDSCLYGIFKDSYGGICMMRKNLLEHGDLNDSDNKNKEDNNA